MYMWCWQWWLYDEAMLWLPGSISFKAIFEKWVVKNNQSKWDNSIQPIFSTDRSQLVEEESKFDDFIENFVGKFGKLTEHYYVTKKQAEFFKQLRKNLEFGECVIVLDFAENYSFLVQDAAQGFHWKHSQATIHPFVIYYVNGSGQITHKSFVCISEHKTHGTATVYSFLKHFYEHYDSNEFPLLHKVFYYSDGSAVQYKNFKNLTNLIFHQNDFHIQVEWIFFAISHGNRDFSKHFLSLLCSGKNSIFNWVFKLNPNHVTIKFCFLFYLLYKVN